MSARGAVGQIVQIANEHEVERVMLTVRVRRAARRLAGRMPEPAVEYLRLLATSAVGYWLLTALIGWATGAHRVYLLAGLAILFSAQATSYKFKLARDPNYEISGCGCGGGGPDGTAAVLRSRESAIVGIPNSALAIALYAGLITAVAYGYETAALALAATAVLASAYLGYVMVVRIESLCSTCINVSALSVLVLGHLVV